MFPPPYLCQCCSCILQRPSPGSLPGLTPPSTHAHLLQEALCDLSVFWFSVLSHQPPTTINALTRVSQNDLHTWYNHHCLPRAHSGPRTQQWNRESCLKEGSKTNSLSRLVPSSFPDPRPQVSLAVSPLPPRGEDSNCTYLTFQHLIWFNKLNGWGGHKWGSLFWCDRGFKRWMSSGLGHRVRGRDLQVEEKSTPSGGGNRQREDWSLHRWNQKGRVRMCKALASVAQLVGASSCKRKVAGWVPVWVRISPVWTSMGGNQSVLLTCIDVSLPSSPSKRQWGGGECKIWNPHFSF